jgi:hypothetical protein
MIKKKVINHIAMMVGIDMEVLSKVGMTLRSVLGQTLT